MLSQGLYIFTASGTNAFSRHGVTYIEIGTIQRKLAWPLCKDDTQYRDALHIFFRKPILINPQYLLIFICVHCFRHRLYQLSPLQAKALQHIVLQTFSYLVV